MVADVNGSLAEGALIHTGRGLLAVQDLRIGDTAFHLDEATNEIKPRVVTDVVRRGTCDVFEIQVGTRTLRSSERQRFLALVDRRRPGRQRRRYRREWCRLFELQPGAIVAVARRTPDVGVLQRPPTPAKIRDGRARKVVWPGEASTDLLWWLGLYVGDGCATKGGKKERSRIEFAIPETQADLREQLTVVSARIFGVTARPRDKWAMVVPGIRLVDYVQAVGLAGKALQKRIPAWVFASPEEQRLAFLGGYVDADGDVRASPDAKNKDMGLTSGNPDLLEDARRLAVSCGIRTSRIWDFRSRDPLGSGRWITGYRMRFAGDFDRIACRSERRQARMRKRKFFHTDTGVGGTTIKTHTSAWLGFARIESITARGPSNTYGVVLQGASNLVAAGMIVGI